MMRVGRPELAVRFFGAGWRMGPAGAGRYMEALYSRATAELREQLGKKSFESEWNAGQHLPLTTLGDAAFAFARSLQTAPERKADPFSAVPETPAPAELTGRELEVLALLVQGHPDRRIAKLLNISPGTVSKHVGSMLGKLGLRNRVELARWAIERHMYE
ncbi:response regulator transcription factor [Deinococcus malanensis]